jgi:hypothetical protein
MIRPALVAVSLACLGVGGGVAVAQVSNNVLGYSASDLSAQWQGVFFSGGEGTSFSMTLIHDGQTIVGSVVEANLFGDPSAAFLLADVSGTVRGGRITFEKTYNGVGGQTHTVRYTGTVSRDGRRISGNWSLNGATGTFEMVR